MTTALTISVYKGKNIIPFVEDLARLRITVFKDYPYLYEGDFAYETNYLKTYIECPESIIVIVLDKDKVVGASTAIPLKYETAECKKPFIEQNYHTDEIFYLGESVLLSAYRGMGVYKHFFYEREKAAREYGSRLTAFCAVERDPHDPRKPKDYLSLNKVWEKFGYKKNNKLCAYYSWKEIGEAVSSEKPLIFWIKSL